MNGLRQCFVYLPLLTVLFLMNSCAEDSAADEDENEGQNEETIVVAGIPEEVVHYQVPSPHEMMEFIKMIGTEFHPELLCNTEIHDKYVDLKGKSMGIGIYIADLAYAANFSRFQESIKYFNVIIKMSDEIGIASTFDEHLLNRIKNNLNQSDSLEVITDESYYKIIQDLEGNDRGKIVAMMAAGGFIESLFIATQLVNKFDANNPLIKRIADQKLVYENLVNYLEQYKEDQNVEWTLNEMEALKANFADVSDNRRDTKFKTNKKGKTVLGGKGGVYIVEQEFEELRYQVSVLRNSITFNPPVPQ